MRQELLDTAGPMRGQPCEDVPEIGIRIVPVHARRLAHAPSTDVQVPTFVPVTLPAPSCAPAPDIRIELRRGATSISLTWPVCAAEHCAAWMRELLK